MVSRKIWFVCYVAGNPEMFNKVHQIGPYLKSEALAHYGNIPDDWRKWVERNTGDRLIENDMEVIHRRQSNSIIVKTSVYTIPTEVPPAVNFKVQGLNPVTGDWDTLDSVPKGQEQEG